MWRTALPPATTSSLALTVGARRFSISRHPDPLVKHGTINTADDDETVEAGEPLLPVPSTADELEIGDIGDDDDMGGFWGDDADDEGDAARGQGGGRGRSRGGGDDYGDLFADPLAASSAADDDEEGAEDAAETARRAAIKEELDARTGRLWDDEWTITDDEWSSPDNFDDLEDWQPNLATRKALESVRVYDRGVPTLKDLAGLNVPRALPPHPGGRAGARKYAKFRKKEVKRRLHLAIQLCVHEDVRKILAMASWEEKQRGVDALFEVVGEQVAKREPVLAQLPEFQEMVEKGLEEVLEMIHAKGRQVAKARRKREYLERQAMASNEEGGEGGEGEGNKGDGDGTGEAEDVVDVMGVNDDPPTPIFMDLLAVTQQNEPSDDDDTSNEGGDQAPRPTLAPFFAGADDNGVPRLLYPLQNHPRDGAGRMVEEWQLAAHKATKRLLVRDSLREIAEKVAGAVGCCKGEVTEEEKGAVRVFVAGPRGVGKTATLAGFVASARVSGHIVIYLPDGDRLRKHGYYIEPDSRRPGMWNLPIIGKELCGELLTSHGDDIRELAVVATREAMAPYLTADQIRRAFKRAYKDDDAVMDEEVQEKTELSLAQLLEVGIGSAALSNGAYATVVSLLMNQTERPFTMVVDEYNTYFDHGHYFHMDYDENVRRAVPPNRIAVFRPFMDALGLYPAETGTAISKDYGGETGGATPAGEATMRWGAVVAGTSESRAVKGAFTRALEDAAQDQASLASSGPGGEDGSATTRHPPPLHVVDVHRLNRVEVQHVLYNYEVTGVGRLRFDRGNTALNPEEVEYLRLVSGGMGQRLLDSCMIRI